MGWTNWLILGVCLAGLYALLLVLYRLFLNVKSLLAAVSKARSLLAELLAYEQIEFTPAKAQTGEDLAEVLMTRRAIEKGREAKARARQRRLLKRISHIEIDKR